MSDQEEVKQEEPVNVDPPEETVGDIMDKSKGEGLKWLVIVASAIVYVAGIVYAEVHGLTMLSKGVAPDMRFWAGLGMIAAGISAIAFPIALKVWTIESRQRVVTYLFYAADFAFLAFNAFTDFNTQTGQQLAPWAYNYVTYILPSSPVLVAGMWAIIWELDPSVREKVQRLSLRMAMKEKMTRKVADAARGAKVTGIVNAAAEREVDRALTELFGAPVTGYVMSAEELPQRRGLLQSFFDLLSRRGSHSTLSQSPQSDSEPQTPPVV
jgi:hypothetical protein